MNAMFSAEWKGAAFAALTTAITPLHTGCFESHEPEVPAPEMHTVECAYLNPDEEGAPCVRVGHKVNAPEEMLMPPGSPSDARNMYCIRDESGTGPLVNCRDRLVKDSVPPGYRACNRREELVMFSNLFACQDR